MVARAETIELRAGPGAWRLTRADPPPDLAGPVVEYWEVEGALAPFRETLLPNGCVELMVNLGPPHRVLGGRGAGTWERGWLSGLHERALVIESLHGTHLVSARLHPLGAAALLGRAVPEHANAIVDLEAILGRAAAELRAGLLAACGPAERFALLERLLRARRAATRADGDPPPDFVRRAAARIEATRGALRIAALHEELGVSRKHLAVTFARHVGVSAKAYARVRRFVWTLERLRERAAVDWPALAAEAGYSDQSHLARDFRRVGAASPTEYLRLRDPGGTALLHEAG